MIRLDVPAIPVSDFGLKKKKKRKKNCKPINLKLPVVVCLIETSPLLLPSSSSSSSSFSSSFFFFFYYKILNYYLKFFFFLNFYYLFLFPLCFISTGWLVFALYILSSRVLSYLISCHLLLFSSFNVSLLLPLVWAMWLVLEMTMES